MNSTLTEECGPVFGHDLLGALDNNLILNFSHGKAPAIGERILVHGRVLDENARPVAGTLIEIWQANAGGRYRHVKDTYFAPLDPNFGGCGRTITGRGRRLRIPDHPPRCLPLAEPRQRLAADAYSFFDLRNRLWPAPDQPDVFRRVTR